MRQIVAKRRFRFKSFSGRDCFALLDSRVVHAEKLQKSEIVWADLTICYGVRMFNERLSSRESVCYLVFGSTRIVEEAGFVPGERDVCLTMV